jgi:DNA-binding beta-propeller fold protein YncE
MEITYIDSSGNNVVTLSLNSTDLVPLSNCPNWTQQTMRFNTDFASQLFGVNITGVQLALRVSLDNPGTNGAITSVVFYDDVFFGVRQCGNLSVGSVAPTAPFVASAPTTLYWLEKVGGAHTIKSGNLDGTGVLPVLYAYKANNQPVNWTASGGSPDEAYGFAVDPVAQKIYWTDSGYSPGMKNPSWKHPGRIMRRNLNGTGPTETLICNVQPESIWSMPGPYGEDFAPMGITLDLVNRQMYWTDPGTQTIRRANMDGDPMGSMQILVDQFDIAADTKGVEDILGHNFDPRDIQLDIASGTMYWTDYSGGELHKGIYQTGRIQRSNMNGSGPIQTLVDHNSGSFATGNPPHPHGIALCITCLVPRMFWSDPVENNIMAANLDGSGSIAVFAENVSGASPSASTPQLLIKMPKGVAVDESAGLVYWTNNHSDSSNNNFSIQRRPLNGLGPIQSIVEVNEQPGPVRAIALVQ